ncbi:hypothetical protein ACOZ4I_13640 [Haloarcula salina]|uniref:hypothetical protein n=1 Tax=Haloarcula salina TaxID=1429914 RepID=UPI003C6F54EC
MPNLRRDAAFAGLCGVCLTGYLFLTGEAAALGSFPAAAVGVGAALALEAVFVADTPVRTLWERRGVRLASAAALVLGALGLAAVSGPLVVAAACWGLATYFVLLVLVLGGYWGEAESE